MKKGTFICYAGGDQKRREGKGGKHSEKKNISFAKEKKNTEKGNFFSEKKKNGEGKFLEKENCCRRDGTEEHLRHLSKKKKYK